MGISISLKVHLVDLTSIAMPHQQTGLAVSARCAHWGPSAYPDIEFENDPEGNKFKAIIRRHVE